MDIINIAKEVFDIEIQSLKLTKNLLDNNFETIVNEIKNCTGKIVLTGIGKSGHIAKKISATLSSLGTPSVYLHPSEAMHGDLGMITKNDIVIAISFSGESNEVLSILPNIKIIDAKLFSITGNSDSTLAKNSDFVQLIQISKEACIMNLAPTSSTTAALVIGDAISVCLSYLYGFDEKSFGVFHPAGSLGKKITFTVEHIMKKEAALPIIRNRTSLRDGIITMSEKGLGFLCIVDNDDLLGVISDGDLRRALQKNINIYDINVNELMTINPYVISKTELAINALKYMMKHNISSLPVVDENKLIGLIRLNDILEKGIFL